MPREPNPDNLKKSSYRHLATFGGEVAAVQRRLDDARGEGGAVETALQGPNSTETSLGRVLA